MTITCPSCAASYRIAADALGPGRLVRCARCREEWFAEGVSGAAARDRAAPLDPEALEPIEGLDDLVAIDAIDSADPHDRGEVFDAPLAPDRRSYASKGWFRRDPRKDATHRTAKNWRSKAKILQPRPAAVIAAIACVALGALIGGRTAIVRASPSLASLYERVGLPVNVRGLTIGEVRSLERIEEGVPLLLVSGLVQNVSGDVIDMPRLKLTIVADRDRELYAWTTVAARAKLAPGESATFRARLASPPAEGRGLIVRFVGETDLARHAR